MANNQAVYVSIEHVGMYINIPGVCGPGVFSSTSVHVVKLSRKLAHFVFENEANFHPVFGGLLCISR